MRTVPGIEDVDRLPEREPHPPLQDVDPLLAGVDAHDVGPGGVRHVDPQALEGASGAARLAVDPAVGLDGLGAVAPDDGVVFGRGLPRSSETVVP